MIDRKVRNNVTSNNNTHYLQRPEGEQLKSHLVLNELTICIARAVTNNNLSADRRGGGAARRVLITGAGGNHLLCQVFNSEHSYLVICGASAITLTLGSTDLCDDSVRIDLRANQTLSYMTSFCKAITR